MFWDLLAVTAFAFSGSSAPAVLPVAASPAVSLQAVQSTARFNEADSLKKRADQLLNAQRVAEALPLYKRAAELFRAELGERHPITLSTNTNYATALEKAGRIPEAARLYARIFHIRQADLGNRSRDTILSAINYGYILDELGRVGEAEPIYAQAIEDARAVLGDSDKLTLNALNNYAAVLTKLGRMEQSLPVIREVLAAYEATLGERDPRTLTALNNVGATLLELERFEEAAPLLEKGLRLTGEARGRTHPETMNSMSNYAFVLVKLGRFDEGAKLHKEVWQTRRRTLGERHPDTLFAQNSYAYIQSLQGRNRDAEALFEQAYREHVRLFGPNHPTTISDLASYTTLLIGNRKNDQALRRSRELVRIIRSRTFRLSQEGLRAGQELERELARGRAIERQHADALWPIYSSARSPLDLELGEEALIALERATSGSASRAVTQAAAARFAQSAGLGALVQERQELEQSWNAMETALIENQSAGANFARRREELRDQLQAVETRVAQIDATLAREAPQFFAILKPNEASFDELISILDKDEVVLFLVPSRFGTHVMALSQNQFHWERSAIAEDAINEAVAELREGLEIAPGEAYLPFFDLELAHGIYSQLFAPVEETLRGKKRVYVVADGALSRLPLGTLVRRAPAPGADADDPDVLRSTDWLADAYALVQLPSVQSLVYLRQYGVRENGSGALARFAGFGAPVLEGAGSTRSARSATPPPIDAARFTMAKRTALATPLMNPAALRQLAALPGTRDELERVRSALGAPQASLFLDKNMTESAIRTADLSQTQVLHLATHGFTSEESGETAEPGLVFTPPEQARAEDDGYLAASEVVGLNLTLAQWVILSACNTASPSGKLGETGLSGLAQAFFYAGAQSLLVSHWPVFDDIAPVLTVEALKRVEAGTPRAEAVQAAIRQIRNDPALEAAHPAVWAPFTLVGEGR